MNIVSQQMLACQQCHRSDTKTKRTFRITLNIFSSAFVASCEIFRASRMGHTPVDVVLQRHAYTGIREIPFLIFPFLAAEPFSGRARGTF